MGNRGEDAPDIGGGSPDRASVGLVEDEDLNPAEDQVALLSQVEQATRGADDDVDPACSSAICDS